MPYTPEKLVQRLAAEKEKTLAFFTSLPEQAWGRQLYTEGEHWTVMQVLLHIVQAENAVLRLLKSIQAGGRGAPEDFDLDGYNERKVGEMAGQSPEEMLALFAARREETLAFVAGLRSEDLALEGRHPFLGVATLEEMIKLMYRHVQIHQRDIRRLVDGG